METKKREKPAWYESDFSDELCPTAKVDLGTAWGGIRLREPSNSDSLRLQDLSHRVQRLNDVIENEKDPTKISEISVVRTQMAAQMTAHCLAIYVASADDARIQGAIGDLKKWHALMKVMPNRVSTRIETAVAVFANDTKPSEVEAEGNASSGGVPTSSPDVSDLPKDEESAPLFD